MPTGLHLRFNAAPGATGADLLHFAARPVGPGPVDDQRVADNQAFIRQAIRDRLPIKLRYHGGSQPGSSRSVTPLRLEAGGTRLLAIDHETGIPKYFKLDRLDTVSWDEPDESPAYRGSEAERARALEYQLRRGY